MSPATTISVHYWASARAAAGVDTDVLEVDAPVTVSEVVRRVLALHDATKLEPVLEVCSVLIGDRPLGTQARDEVTVAPGESVEFLPPFAGG
jgi:molybdopterin synthase sulfur carrier subunit